MFSESQEQHRQQALVLALLHLKSLIPPETFSLLVYDLEQSRSFGFRPELLSDKIHFRNFQHFARHSSFTSELLKSRAQDEELQASVLENLLMEVQNHMGQSKPIKLLLNPDLESRISEVRDIFLNSAQYFNQHKQLALDWQLNGPSMTNHIRHSKDTEIKRRIETESYKHVKSVFGHGKLDDEFSGGATISCVAFDKSGKYIISGADDFKVKIWEADTAQLQATLMGHADFITDFDVSKTNRYIVTASKDRSIRIWDYRKIEEVIFLAFNDGVDLAKFTDTEEFGELLVAFSTDGVIHIYQFQKFLDETVQKKDKKWWIKQRQLFFPDSQKVEDYHSSPRKTRSFFENSEARESEFQNAKRIPSFTLKHEFQNKNVVFSVVTITKHGVVCAGAKNGEFVTWKLEKRSFAAKRAKHISTEKLQKKAIHLLELNHNHDFIFAGSIDGSAIIWELKKENKYKPEKYFMIDDRDTKNCVQCDTVAWSARSRYAFCAISGIKKFKKSNEESKGPVTPRSTIYVIQMDSKAILHQLGEEDSILLEYYTFALMTHPRYENIVVSGSASGKIVVWDAVQGVALLKFIETGIYSYEPFLMNDIFDGRFSPDGNTFVVGTVLGALSIYSTNSAESYAHTHTEQFFLAEGLTPDELEENIASKSRICNHQLAQYEPQPPINMVRGLTRETMTKLTLEEKMNQFEEFLRIQQKEFTFLKQIKAIDQDGDNVSEMSITEVINNLENEVFLNFFEADSDEDQEDILPLERQHCETEQDQLLFAFHKRRIEVKGEKDLFKRIRNQVEKENQYYQEQKRVIEAELNINEEAFGRVLEEHTFEETMGQRDEDTPTNSRMRRNAATPMRVQVQSAPARQQRQRVSLQRNAQARDAPMTRLRGENVLEEQVKGDRERRSLRRVALRGESMMIPTAWNPTGVQPHRRSREAMNTIEDSDSERGHKNDNEYSQYPSSQQESERRLRPNRKTKYDYDEEQYFAFEEESEEDDDELGSDQDFEAFNVTTTRRSNRISKRKYESSEGSLSELEPYHRTSNEKSQFASSRNSRAIQSRSSNREVQQLSQKLREQQKAQAKIEPYILYFTEKNPYLLSICQFCKRTLGHESSYIGPFKRDDSKCEIQNSNFSLEDLPEKAFIHLSCLRINDLTYEYRMQRNDPTKTMWVCIVEFFLCKLADEEPRECTRCNETNYTVTCFQQNCAKVFHGHICAELNGLNQQIEGYLRFKCYECLWKQKTQEIKQKEQYYGLFQDVDRSDLYRFIPHNLSQNTLRMKESREKEIPPGIKQFINMSQEQFLGQTVNFTNQNQVYAIQKFRSIQAAYKFHKDYIPQIGDEVIFIPQKYQEILSKNWMEVEGLKEAGQNVITNLKEILDLADCPFSKGGIPIKITNIAFLFPNLKGLTIAESQNQQQFPAVILKLTVSVLSQPTSSVNEEEVKEQKDQKVLNIYLTAQDLSCFVEIEIYEATLREYGSQFINTSNLKRFNGTEQELIRGQRVRINSTYIYEISTSPFSYYKCFSALLLESSEQTEILLSPWDLKPTESMPQKEENIPFKLRQQIVRRFYELLSERKKDFFWFFTFVKQNLAADYNCVIPVESNTNLIMKRLVYDYYRRREALERDIELIQINAYEYNQDDEEIRALAHECTTALLTIVEECFRIKETILTREPIGTVEINMNSDKPKVRFKETYEEVYEDPGSSSSFEIEDDDDEDFEESASRSKQVKRNRIKIRNDSNPRFLTPSGTTLRRSSRNRSGEPSLTKVQVQEVKENPNLIKISKIQMDAIKSEKNSDNKRRNSKQGKIDIHYNEYLGSVKIQIDNKFLQPSVQTRSKSRKIQ